MMSVGWNSVHKKTLPDEADQIAAEMSDLVDRADVILTTGGTGLGPRDVTPEATREIAHREIPGFGELMRAEGRKLTKFADLSRGGAASRATCLIINLPGSPKGAVESLGAVAHLIPHSIELLRGRT